MGAKTWMLVFSDDPAAAFASHAALDREATLRLAAALFPRDTLEGAGEGDLSFTCPPDDEIHIGCFADVAVVAAREFAIDYPSRLPPSLLAPNPFRHASLHAMHSAVDWFAYAKWIDGKLVRALSLSSDTGILEDKGQRLPFEAPYWAGRHPAVKPADDPEPYPLPFHPLDLGEAALHELFGYTIEGYVEPQRFSPEAVPLMRLKRSRASRWRFWR